MKKAIAFMMIISILWITGCGSSSSVKPATQLPPLGERLSNLEGGLSVAAPEGWKTRPRSGSFLARFVGADNADYPTILVTAKPSESITGTLTEADVPKFAAELKLPTNDFQVLGDETTGKKFFVAYSPFNNEYDRQCMATVNNGLIFTVELRIQKNLMANEHIGLLMAVASGMTWSSETSTPVLGGSSTDTDFPAIGSAFATEEAATAEAATEEAAPAEAATADPATEEAAPAEAATEEAAPADPAAE